MEEYIDIVSKDGKYTGKTALKSVIHSKGYYHHTAHIWLYTKDDQILLAQRASSKVICPSLWDVSVAGHVDAGETIVEGTLREVNEEIGLKLSEKELFKIGVFDCFQKYSNGIIDNEFHHTYIAELNISISKLKPQEGEVDGLKLVSFSEFKTPLKDNNNSHFVKSNSAYYLKVLKFIKKHIT